ncbi:hypothetical protein VPDG_00125 [Vibrio phage henriette 12B8]|uniref:tail protein n=1 Tax=Vibrio phage henriette 12B8 TaxID=573174 RepID=UPI0002C0C479|nr:tail protein [Vibrio phage henriette 12B8]AGG58286.1 hypothetical protein VPDG_00125 [Vibrio phage henriette 12B8]
MSYPIILLTLDLTAAPSGNVHRLCTAPHDIIYGGYLYTAVGDLLSIDELETSADLNSVGTTITLSGIDPAYRREIDNNGFRNAPIELAIGYVNDNTNTIPNGTAVIIHTGTCESPITDVNYESGEMTIGVSTNSIWGNLDKVPDLSRASYATHSSRHCYDKDGNFSPDETFKYVASTANEEKWIS